MSAFYATLIGIAVLIALSALFSASETALTSISRIRLKRLKKSRDRADQAVVRLLNDRNRMITTILIGNNLVNIWSSSLATAFAIHRFGEEGVAIATGAMTVILLIFGELTPKTLANRFPLPFSRRLAPVISGFKRLLVLPVLAFSAINTAFIAMLNAVAHDSSHSLTEEEIRAMVDLGEKDGALEARERHLMQRAFDLTDRRVREIMTTRTAFVAVESEADISTVRSAFRNSGFSRLPVFKVNLDEIVGVLHFNDLVPGPDSGAQFGAGPGDGQDLLPGELARKALFVPETQTIPALLSQLDRERQHMAIVVDERGNTAGLVTLDDAITSIFGVLGDRADRKEPSSMIQVISPDRLKVPGNLRLDDFNALLQSDLDSDHYETVGGFMLERIGKLPSPGERYQAGRYCLTVEEVAERAIVRIDVEIRPNQRG